MPARVSPSDEQRAAIVAAARECIGTPFHLNHREPGRAIDCVGVIRHCMERAGLYCPPDTHYSIRNCSGEHTYLDARDAMDEVPRESLAPGSIPLLWLSKPYWPQHLGVWTGESLIHAHMRTKRVIETAGVACYDAHVFGVFDMRQTAEPAHEVEGFTGIERTPGTRRPELTGKPWREWCAARIGGR